MEDFIFEGDEDIEIGYFNIDIVKEEVEEDGILVEGDNKFDVLVGVEYGLLSLV